MTKGRPEQLIGAERAEAAALPSQRVSMESEARTTWQMLVVVGASVLVVGVVFAWSKALFPLLAAFLFAYLCHPLASFFERRHMPRILGFFVVVLGMVAVGAFVVFVFLPALVNELVVIGQRLPSWREVVNERFNPLLDDLRARYPQGYSLVEARVRLWAESNLPTVAERVAAWAVHMLSSALGLLGLLVNLVLIPVIAAYLTTDFRAFVDSSLRLIPRQVLPTVVSVGRDVNSVLGAFIKGQLLISLALGVMYTGGLLAVGAPLALVIGPLAGILSLVPYLGLVLGAGTATLLSFLEFQDLSHPGGVLLTFAIAQAVEGYILTPRLLGRSVGLHPVWVLVSLIVGGELFGLPGIIIGVPVAAALRVVLIRATRTYRGSAFYGARTHAIVLYTKPSCAVCDEMKVALDEFAAAHDVGFVSVDVLSTPELTARYGPRVPVIEVDGKAVAEGHLEGPRFGEVMEAALGGRA